jgi:hypothetical protein
MKLAPVDLFCTWSSIMKLFLLMLPLFLVGTISGLIVCPMNGQQPAKAEKEKLTLSACQQTLKVAHSILKFCTGHGYVSIGPRKIHLPCLYSCL